MSKVEEEIAELLNDITKGDRRKAYVVKTGIVKEVNTDDWTCKVALNVNDEDNVTEGVFVNVAMEVTEGLILQPAVDSVVWVADLDGGGNMGIVKCGVLDTYALLVGNSWIKVREGGVSVKAGDYTFLVSPDNKVQINGDAFGGLVKVADLVTKLNNLEDDLNTLKNLFNAWVPIPNDGGAALKAISTTWAGEIFTPTTATDLKNDNVTHG